MNKFNGLKFLGVTELLYFTFSLAQSVSALNIVHCSKLKKLTKLSTSTCSGWRVAAGKLIFSDYAKFVSILKDSVAVKSNCSSVSLWFCIWIQ